MDGIESALEASLKISKVPRESAAIVALTRKYARLLDAPAAAAKYRKPLALLETIAAYYLDAQRLSPVDRRAVEDAVHTITTALGEHSVASDLGPKLLAALTSLGMTLPATGDGTVPSGGGTATDDLEQLRRQRRDRERGAKDLDASTS